MANLYFYHATMNAGKTTYLLQFNYSCIKNNINTLIFIPNLFKKTNIVKSRIGIQNIAIPLFNNTNIFLYIKKHKHMIKNILIDEAQFLTKKQIFELICIVDFLNIDVLTFGLKTDFKFKLFIGSNYLLSLADEIIEMKTLCKCGKKAIANARLLPYKKKALSGDQINLNKNVYVAICRYHYFNLEKIIN